MKRVSERADARGAAVLVWRTQCLQDKERVRGPWRDWPRVSFLWGGRKEEDEEEEDEPMEGFFTE